MTNNTEMVSVPREWLNRVALLQMPLDELQDQVVELLCEPCDEPAEDVRAVVGEPVWRGWAVQYPGKLPKIYGERHIAELNCYAEEGARLIELSEPLCRRPQRPVVMPSPRKAPSDPLKWGFVDGWNACLDELARLNK